MQRRVPSLLYADRCVVVQVFRTEGADLMASDVKPFHVTCLKKCFLDPAPTTAPKKLDDEGRVTHSTLVCLREMARAHLPLNVLKLLTHDKDLWVWLLKAITTSTASEDEEDYAPCGIKVVEQERGTFQFDVGQHALSFMVVLLRRNDSACDFVVREVAGLPFAATCWFYETDLATPKHQRHNRSKLANWLRSALERSVRSSPNDCFESFSTALGLRDLESRPTLEISHLGPREAVLRQLERNHWQKAFMSEIQVHVKRMVHRAKRRSGFLLPDAEYIAFWVKMLIARPSLKNNSVLAHTNSMTVGHMFDAKSMSSRLTTKNSNGVLCIVLPSDKDELQPMMLEFVSTLKKKNPTARLWYHGTGARAATSSNATSDAAFDIAFRGIDPQKGQEGREFGAGEENWKSFYVGDRLDQAVDWAFRSRDTGTGYASCLVFAEPQNMSTGLSFGRIVDGDDNINRGSVDSLRQKLETWFQQRDLWAE